MSDLARLGIWDVGRDFAPTQSELKRARRTKADQLFWFDEVPVAMPSMTASSMWGAARIIETPG